MLSGGCQVLPCYVYVMETFQVLHMAATETTVVTFHIKKLPFTVEDKLNVCVGQFNRKTITNKERKNTRTYALIHSPARSLAVLRAPAQRSVTISASNY